MGIKPFRELMEENKKSLDGLSSTTKMKQCFEDDRKAKEKWWRNRKDINQKLRILLDMTEKRYLNHPTLKNIFTVTANYKNVKYNVFQDVMIAENSDDSSDDFSTEGNLSS